MSIKQERLAAIDWWRRLTEQEQDRLAALYRPNWTIDLVDMSTSTLLFIYQQEHNDSTRTSSEYQQDA